MSYLDEEWSYLSLTFKNEGFYIVYVNFKSNYTK